MSDYQPRSIDSWPVENVIPYVKNAKIHDPSQVHKIAKAIREHGWDQPIVVDGEGVIIKGHGRRLAAMELGMKFVPVIVRDDLTEDQVKAARLADNRVAEGDVDAELLQEELMVLADAGIDLEGLGFDERELSFLTGDLDEMDTGALLDDLNDEVAEQADRIEQKSEEAGEKLVSLNEAFGFKGVTTEQARNLNKFMAKLEDDSGEKGADALMSFVEPLTAEW